MNRLTGPCCPSAVPRSVGSRTRPSVVHSRTGIDRPCEPRAGAPNILFVLIDDAGFGNPSTFGGPIRTPPTTVARGHPQYLAATEVAGHVSSRLNAATIVPTPPAGRIPTWRAGGVRGTAG